MKTDLVSLYEFFEKTDFYVSSVEYGEITIMTEDKDKHYLVISVSSYNWDNTLKDIFSNALKISLCKRSEDGIITIITHKTHGVEIV